ncbi:KAP family P-loop domain-containing protein [Amycolatopsis pretoriensis]|uniref:KAP family P-loop domain-containing protein n=1 Tax=Amycolatopsis pretoriensis TaxID=218821 RepID=A0A1H5Q7Q6_9PSEU|nr:P-loop NTPase fold protein [Amycolatopsis pretoriensis]SEF21924.1 KAP family P-loop domain-containing protein [Amycolatopsis pretoriensis]
MSAQEFGDDDLVPLQTIDGVSYAVALTEQPWDLPVDALAISVGAGYGSLGDAVQDAFPGAGWELVDLDSVTPAQPITMDLPARTGRPRLRLAVLATPHDKGRRNDPTPSAITTATTTAITAAAGVGATAIAVPLFATGRLGVPASVAARAVIEGALAAKSGIREVVFFSDYSLNVDAIRKQWAADVPGAAAFPAPGTTAPEPAPVPRVPVFSEKELAGGVARDLVDPNESIALTEDHLGVSPYVSMLATVIAAKDTPLPLSIGVFGEWGSGKSFFMGMLRGQVKSLEGTPGHCAKIAQVGFNAWHYADANLWASLGDEIFRQLAEPARRPGERDEEHEARLREGARLREQLAAELEQRKQLTAVTERAQAEAAALKHRIGEAEHARKVRAGDLLRALRKSRTFHEEYDGLWRKLGVGDLADQGKLLADEMRGAHGETEALARIARYRHGRAALVTAAVVLAAGAAITAFVPDVKAWLTGVGVVFAGLAATGLALVGAARAGLRRLRVLAEDLRGGLDEGAQQELLALRKADAEQQIAEQQLAEVVTRIGELGRQLTELTPGRRLYAFLAERSRGEDYRGNLGLISTIRKDFEKLVALMTAPVAEGEEATRPLDRIVLYIDDLDRCSPQQVVDVLQAVHLLLAFDLFVVVVGVDPRWLLRSLSTHYDRLIEADAVVRADGWHVTPEDYLEKILNIPLVLPRMPAGSLQRLLWSMTDTPAAADPGERKPAEPAHDVETGVVANAPVPAIPVEPGSQVAAQLAPGRPAEVPRPLTDPEITLLSKLDRLVDTPRDAKRLINLYRMLRATRDLSDASTFLAGEYEAVVVLLGTCTAHGRLLGRFADALLRAAPETPWSDFVGRLRPVEREERWVSEAVGRIPTDEAAQWEHLHGSLDELTTAVTLPDVRVFQRWVPRVRRFSYVLSPGAR